MVRQLLAALPLREFGPVLPPIAIRCDRAQLNLLRRRAGKEDALQQSAIDKRTPRRQRQDHHADKERRTIKAEVGVFAAHSRVQ